MYHALKGQHLTFSTHYQPYPHHTPNALDLLPKWLHGSKIQKSRKVDFSTFSWDPSKFPFIEKFLVAYTIPTLHIHMYWVMLFQTHYQPWWYDPYNKLNKLSKLHTKTKNRKYQNFDRKKLHQSLKKISTQNSDNFFVFLNYLNNHELDRAKKKFSSTNSYMLSLILIIFLQSQLCSF